MIQKVGKWVGGIIIGLVVLLLVGVHAVTPIINGGEGAAEKHFDEAGVKFRERTNHWNDRPLHWIETGNDSANTLIFFMHGAPGSWKDHSQYLIDPVLNEKAYMVAMDRPGYGLSGYGNTEPSINAQVEAAGQVLSNYDFERIVLVGYSYGGPVAGALAAKMDSSLHHLLMLAPVNHPDHEKIFWFNYVIDFLVVNWLLPGYIRVANVEKLQHARALAEIEGLWDDIRAPVTHVHCTDDWIAPFEANVAFSRDHIPDSLLTLVTWTGDNHFLPNNVRKRVLPVIYGLLEE